MKRSVGKTILKDVVANPHDWQPETACIFKNEKLRMSLHQLDLRDFCLTVGAGRTKYFPTACLEIHRFRAAYRHLRNFYIQEDRAKVEDKFFKIWDGVDET